MRKTSNAHAEVDCEKLMAIVGWCPNRHRDTPRAAPQSEMARTSFRLLLISAHASSTKKIGAGEGI
jgi:hypothetical protein